MYEGLPYVKHYAGCAEGIHKTTEPSALPPGAHNIVREVDA